MPAREVLRPAGARRSHRWRSMRPVVDYDDIADRYDTRYAHYAYDGVRETLLNFLGPEPNAVLEVGCGTGHWLAVARRRSAERRRRLTGVDPVGADARRALRRAAPASPRVRASGPGARRRSAVARRDVRPPLLRQRPPSFRRPRPVLRRGAPRAQARRGTADDRQGSPHRSRRMVGLRLLRRDARDRSRALRAGADAARRDGAGRVRVDGVVGGGSHRGAAAGERGAGQRDRRSGLHVAADRAVGRGVQPGSGAPAAGQRRGRRRAAAGRRLPALRHDRPGRTLETRVQLLVTCRRRAAP